MWFSGLNDTIEAERLAGRVPQKKTKTRMESRLAQLSVYKGRAWI